MVTALVTSPKLSYVEPSYSTWISDLPFLRIHPGHCGLAIPPRVSHCAMSTGDGFGHWCGRNCEFCVVVGLLAYTHGLISRLKVLTVNLSQPSGRHGSYMPAGLRVTLAD